ncbi:hypothetical protein N7509_002663 [Penicillium cosmopolitanum]|uniref:tyrosinase n=1 Tax=Penicillium cosmopolitanum TaxID=1131564 RepID=A0A9X0BDN5_9EURO|nr:uncharacterized protein N7509_002663 [Penicillium cosmopolitanum]KAJ5408780.1 hypothetical protein N7509_002663 [Penicillium cosmopolitanum]
MSKSDHKYYPITGVPVGDLDLPNIGFDTPVPIRQNIDTWSKDPENEKQVQLFVLGLDRYQKIDPLDRDSYFQAAGIHGQPNVPWDEPIDADEAAGKGYCTHNNILFPIWHRAYLALYEQRIYECMLEIIPNFPEEDREEWTELAHSWRLPFWDFGAQVSVPELCKYPTIAVPTFDGKDLYNIPNPLYQFRMPTHKPMGTAGIKDFVTEWDGDAKQELFFSECIATSRWPEEGDNASGTSTWKYGVVNNSKVRDALTAPKWDEGGEYGQASEMVHRLLNVDMDYLTFATTGLQGDDQPVEKDLNLEYIHNNIHGWVGGDHMGHMSQIPMAAFDPSFWLLHCNADRLFALWQAKNPDKWFTESKVNAFLQDAIGLPPGSVITPETGLRPFHKDVEGTLMVSADVRYPHKIGHTYPELQTWKYKQPGYQNKDFQADLQTAINDLYGTSRKTLLDAGSKLKGVEVSEDSFKALDFSFSVRFRKYAFGGDPFWVRIYLSQDGVKQNPSSDKLTEVYNFSQKPQDEAGKLACANCKGNEKNGLKVNANISITPVLLNLLKLGKDLTSLNKDEVLKFLQDRVYWRVTRGGKGSTSIIGATNDTTVFQDASKPPILSNFVKEPTISGGKDGALSPHLKQPVTIPPPAVPKIPKAALKINTNRKFKESLKADAVVLIDSNSLNLTPAKTKGIDNTQFYFTDGNNDDGNILFLLSIRRAENAIVFNSRIDNNWGKEVRVSLEGRFRTDKPSILVHDQGDGYEVFIDWKHVLWFEKRAKDKIAKTISYTVNDGQKSVLSAGLNVKVYSSMASLFNH